MPRDEGQLEIWGGVECSHVLINGKIRDQLFETGHQHRLEDLDLVHSLGVKTLRYPALWARTSHPEFDFTWEDARLEKLFDLGIDPIVGFLHHGSGPGGLHPLQEDFVNEFSDHAERVALRYPWLRRFTPINEPVTTARFSYLYGHWHPHLRDEGAFLRAVATYATATVAAMNRIQRHIPEAQLIQTEDLGRVFAPPLLAQQADYENERRFLFLDLLTGQVRRGHRFWERLRNAGVDADDLDRLVEAPFPPQVIGIDQYLTSDRYLDPHLDRHPVSTHGGNGREVYADIAAAHVSEINNQTGFLARIQEVYLRYELPIALTEVHNGARPEGQLRWLAEAWRAAKQSREEGIPVKAVASWSLFGCVDWDSLLCEKRVHYEPGAFDVRFDPPRQTAIGHAIRRLVKGEGLEHPLLEQNDWWRPPHPFEPMLLLVMGPHNLAGRFVDHCTARRIAAAVSGAFQPQMGQVVIQQDEAGLSFRGLTPDGTPLVNHRSEATACFDQASHLFLDLMIDRIWKEYAI